MDRGGKPQWSGKSRGGYLGHAFFVWCIRRLGVPFAYGVLSLVVVYFIPFAPRATQAVWRFHRRRLGCGWGRALVRLYRHYYRFGQTIVDRVALAEGSADRYRFVFEDYDRFLKVLDGGCGAILVGGHVGCWEIGSRFFGDYASKINVVMYDAEYERVKEALGVRRRYKVIPVGSDGLASILAVKSALDAGEYVCFQGDRYMPGSRTVTCGFLGAPARFPEGPFAVAARLGVPVAYYYAVRESRRTYRFRFETVPPGLKEGSAAMLERYVSSLESVVRAYPLQWFNFYDFWNNGALI